MQIQDVDLRLLRVFVAIVECGGLAAAESRLNIGRSTISSHLSDLEIRLGFRLCKRGRGGFELTEPGRVTYQACLELLQQCEVFATKVAGSRERLSGRLTLAIVDTLIHDPRCQIATAINALKSQGGHVQFEINVGEPRETELDVINGRSLVGIGVSRHHLSGLDYQPLFHETNYLYCASSHPLFDCPESKIEALLSEAEIISSGHMRDLETRNDGLPHTNSAIAYHDEGIAHLIHTGQFIGYLPEQYARQWVSNGQFKAIKPKRYAYRIPVMMITTKNTMTSNIACAFIKEMQDIYQTNQ